MELYTCVHVSVFLHTHARFCTCGSTCTALAWLHVQGLLFVPLPAHISVCIGLCVSVSVCVCIFWLSKSSLILQFCDRIKPVFKSLYCRNDHVLYFVVTRESWYCCAQTVFRKPPGLGCKSVKWNHRVLSVCLCAHLQCYLCNLSSITRTNG